MTFDAYCDAVVQLLRSQDPKWRLLMIDRQALWNAYNGGVSPVAFVRQHPIPLAQAYDSNVTQPGWDREAAKGKNLVFLALACLFFRFGFMFIAGSTSDEAFRFFCSLCGWGLDFVNFGIGVILCTTPRYRQLVWGGLMVGFHVGAFVQGFLFGYFFQRMG